MLRSGRAPRGYHRPGTRRRGALARGAWRPRAARLPVRGAGGCGRAGGGARPPRAPRPPPGAPRLRFRPRGREALRRVAGAQGLARARAETAVALADGSAARMFAAAGADDGAAWDAIARLGAAVAAPGMTPALDAAVALAGDK